MQFLSVGRWRLVTGLVQGVALYVLYKAVEHSVWPATDGLVFAPLLSIVLIVPVIVSLSLGNMRARTLAAWALVAAALLAGLGGHDMLRRGGLDNEWMFWSGHTSSIYPSASFIFFTVIGFFIAQSLIMAADAEGRHIASYPRYFDTAWKLALQLILSFVFTGLFWLVLGMGVALFLLVKMTFLQKLIEHDWFHIPATTLAFACAIHVTDVRVNLVRGIRTLTLILLSWLLPIMTLFVAGFLISLPFKGIALLWATHHTSQILLGAAAWLILLINATYQDGTPEHSRARILRLCGTLASLLLSPLVVIAIYALALRVGQYGWTTHLIEVCACLVVAACYAVGYLWSAVTPGPWLRRLEPTNIFASFVILAVLLALFTPIADPARLSVADQISRLKNGRVSADKFDYAYLGSQGAIYGVTALNRLKAEAKGPGAATVKQKIDAALASPYARARQVVPPRPEDMLANITVYPKGQSLPDTFIKQDWSAYQQKRWTLPECLFDKKAKCDAFVVEAANEAPQQIILLNSTFAANGVLLKAETGGWVLAGGFSSLINCKGVREAMQAGQFKLAPSAGQDLEVDGMHIRINQDEKCPESK